MRTCCLCQSALASLNGQLAVTGSGQSGLSLLCPTSDHTHTCCSRALSWRPRAPLAHSAYYDCLVSTLLRLRYVLLYVLRRLLRPSSHTHPPTHILPLTGQSDINFPPGKHSRARHICPGSLGRSDHSSFRSLLASSYALHIQHQLRPDTNREAHALLVYIHHPYSGQRGCVSACRNHRVINGARRAGGRTDGRAGGWDG